MESFPLWAVALVIAAAMPWCVRAFSQAMDRRVRRRTEDTIARAAAED